MGKHPVVNKNRERGFIGIFVLLVAAGSFLAPGECRGQVESGYIEEAVRLDGILNEPFWESIEPVIDFTQRELSEGAPPTERTEVRFAFDEDNFYIGVICFDSEPEKIIHKQLKRDVNPDSDDRISFAFDTYNDMRMGYLFSTNPNGFRYDATFRGGADKENVDWDGIWDVRARITDQGWSCEIVIPFKTLRFPTTDTQVWRLNIKRTIRRKNEELHFRGWHRDDRFLDLSKTGTLLLDKPLKATRQVDLKPYLLTGAERTRDEGTDEVLRAGLDVRYGITSNATLQLTTKTDFSQIESDREVINLTRFDIHYPEKRDFFLEGQETFDFTQGGTRLFYSRRIGISPDREEIPVLGGAKFIQKTGSLRLGVLSMQTEGKHGIPGTNYTVARIKQDVFDQSYIGFIATSVLDRDNHDSQVLGTDFILRTNSFLGDKNFEVQGYLSGSLTDGKGTDNLAGRVFVAYPNDLIDAYVLHHVIDTNYNPEIGFVSRTGIRNSIARINIRPRPSIPHVKQLLFKPVDVNYTTDMNNRLLTRKTEFRPFGIVTDYGDEFIFEIMNEYDYLDEDFDIFDDVVISPGTYAWWYYQANFTSNESRPVSFEAEMQWGDFYSGTRDMVDVACTFKLSRFYSLTADVVYNNIIIAERSFDTREYGGRIDVDVSTRLSSSAYVQWNNETNEVNVNYRIHWEPKLGSDLYIVYNHLMDERDRYRTLRNTGMLKMDYTYRF